MKTSRVMILGFIILILIGATVPVNAVLIDNGDGTITDTDTKLMWLQDANYAATLGYFAYGSDSGGTGMSWDDAMTWASTLFFAGFSDWGLPYATNPDGSGPTTGWFSSGGTGELVYLAFYEGIMNSSTGPFTNLHPLNEYWTGTEFALDNDDAYSNVAAANYSISLLRKKLVVVGPDQWIPKRLGAWAVRDCSSCTESVKVVGAGVAYYWSLQEAYDNANDGDIIQAKAVTFIEDVFVDDLINKSVIVQGGYDNSFSTITGMTALNGNIILSHGSLSVDNIILQ